MLRRVPASSREHGGRPPARLVLLGALTVVLGVLFIVVPKAAGRSSAVVLGLLLVVTGLVEALSGRRGEPEQHRSVLVGGGTLSLVVGVVVLARPGAAPGLISLLFVVLLLGAGLEAIWLSTAGRYPGWQWDCLFGAAAVIFGAAIVGRWPSLALWLPGTLVGIAVIVRGATMLVGGLDQHAGPRSIQSV